MYKGLWNNHLSFGHHGYTCETFTHSTIPTMDVKQECTNYVNANTAFDTIHSSFTIREVTYESNNTIRESTFEDIRVKEEPIFTGEDEEDPLDNINVQYRHQIPTNAIIKEEVIIQCEEVSYILLHSIILTAIPINYPDPVINMKFVLYFQMDKINTETITTTENRDKQKLPKRRKKVYKNWQKDTVFPLESDALNVIRNEQIWTRYSNNRSETCTKIIYRCRNVKSKGQQCDAGVYLLYSHIDPSVTLFRSSNRHTCESIDTKRKRPFKLDSCIETKVTVNNVKSDENQPDLKRSKNTLENWQIGDYIESKSNSAAKSLFKCFVRKV